MLIQLILLVVSIQFQGLVMLFLPKTPQYLMIQKKDAEAEAIIKKLNLTSNVRQTMTDIRLTLTEEYSSGLCQSENNMNGRMLIGIILVMAQQLTGSYLPTLNRNIVAYTYISILVFSLVYQTETQINNSELNPTDFQI